MKVKTQQLKNEEAPTMGVARASNAEPTTKRKAHMTHSITNIAPDNVPELSYRGKPVVTTSVLAALYGTEAKYIQNNYKRNETRFEEGKHYFKVTGNELKELKKQPSLRGLVSKMVSHLLLYTERGAARHAKMLETDAAWDVFEALEDHYFGQSVNLHSQNKALPNPLTPAHQRGIQKAVGRRCFNLPEAARPKAYKRIYSHLKDRFGVAKYDQIPDDRYTEALGAVESYSFSGDFLEAEAATAPQSVKVFGIDQWLDMNFYIKHRQMDSRRILITAKHLIDSEYRSPCMRLIKELEAEGHDLSACRLEVASLRHHLESSVAKLEQVIGIAQGVSSQAVSFAR